VGSSHCRALRHEVLFNTGQHVGKLHAVQGLTGGRSEGTRAVSGWQASQEALFNSAHRRPLRGDILSDIRSVAPPSSRLAEPASGSVRSAGGVAAGMAQSVAWSTAARRSATLARHDVTIGGFTTGCYKRLVVLLIKPSKYDDDGYVIRHWRGTLPSNTLACLNSLTDDVFRSGELGPIDVRVKTIDETVTRVDARALGRRYRRHDTKVVVGLAGVQSNQLPRARDLALQFKEQGFDVIIGGFHVSGAMAMSSATPPECQELLDAGVTLVLGEVEGRWSGILQDAVADRLQPLYDFLRDPPDLADWPVPRPSRRTQKKFVVSRNGTIDAGRGCPFFCSFCTIINVQGRRMRSRGAAAILEQIRQNYGTNGSRGVRHYFFTDDNFARNPQWEAIFDGLIALREEENLDVDFMMQVDTLAASIPRFVEKAARAGCVQVFIGMESVRDDNLKAGGKPQNRSAGYRDMVARWHEVGVVCHAGFIIGFPYDTYERIIEDVRTLSETILVDHASFFMLMPIPGSRDHLAAMESGAALDSDYNNYDSCHATAPHPRMSRDEWERAFRDAWKQVLLVQSTCAGRCWRRTRTRTGASSRTTSGTGPA
jgi:radical SAM superfamily enzyme YgiQ (UPF0313 family)